MAGQVDRRRGLYLWQGQYRIPDPGARSTGGNRSLSTSGHPVSRGQFYLGRERGLAIHRRAGRSWWDQLGLAVGTGQPESIALLLELLNVTNHAARGLGYQDANEE